MHYKMKRFLLTFLVMAIFANMNADDNPFLKPFSTEHGTPPFDKIKIEHFEPAFDKAISEHQQEIDAIAMNNQAPSFSNTIETLEISGDMLDRVSTVFFNLLSAESNDEMMQISQNLSPKLSEHSNNP